MAEQKVIEGTRSIFTSLSYQTPLLIMPGNDDRQELLIQNRLDDDIFIGSQAQLVADKNQGTLIGSGLTITIPRTDEVYAVAKSTTSDAAGVLLAVENIFIDT